jgi:hypothetical protein
MEIRRIVYAGTLAAVLAAVPLLVPAAAHGRPAAAPAGSGAAHGRPAAAPGSGAAHARPAALPVSRMEAILGADGDVTHGVLGVEPVRSDLHVRGGAAQVRFVPDFGIHHDLYFQPLPGGRALFNGDIAVRAAEIPRALDAMLSRGLEVQAEHQHLYDLEPMVWFLHLRGTGQPLALARAVRAVLDATATPLPQHRAAHPATTLPAAELGRILHGDATVGDDGVVTVVVPRTDRIVLGGVPVSPDLNVSTNVEFQPLPGGRAAVLPDFSMTSAEIRPVLTTLRRSGWEIGCLYNQETAEHPQLYFSHAFATGDPVALARQIREAVAHTAVP